MTLSLTVVQRLRYSRPDEHIALFSKPPTAYRLRVPDEIQSWGERFTTRRRSSIKSREGVSTAQLMLLLGGLAVETNTTLAEVDAKLRASSGLDEKQRQDEAKAAEGKKPRQHLRSLKHGLRREVPTGHLFNQDRR